MKYFLKYKTNIILLKSNEKIKNKNISLKIYDKLYKDSILRKKIRDKLINKYLIIEEEKYPFNPKINPGNIYCYINNVPYLYYDNFDKIILFSERKFRPSSFNKNYIIYDKIDDLSSNNYNNYIKKSANRRKPKNYSSSSLPCYNFDLNNLYNEFFNNNRYTPINKKNKKYKNNNKSSTTYKKDINLFGNLFPYEYKINSNKKKIVNNHKNKLNKTSYKPYPGMLMEKFINSKNKYNIPYNDIKNDEYYNYFNKKIKKKSKNKKIKKNNSQEIIIPKLNDKYLKEKIFSINDIHIKDDDLNPNNKNNNSSLYNEYLISPIKNKNNKNNSKSIEKKEHLFSFGTDYIDNNISLNNNIIDKKYINNNSPIKNNRKSNRYINNNNKSKTNNNNSIRSNHLSTNYSGNNSIYNLNNNINDNMNKQNRGSNEKINISQFEVQSSNEYFILNDKNEDLKKNDYNGQTTIQTLNDSKLLKLAENIIPEDDSLDSFRKKSLLYNKRHFRVYSPKKYKK